MSKLDPPSLLAPAANAPAASSAGISPFPLRVVVLGAGKIGRTIAAMLHDSGDYRVTLVDRDPAQLQGLPEGIAVGARALDRAQDCAALLRGADAVLNALPFHAAVGVATVAASLGVHYFDLTEDVAATHAICALAVGARSVLMPQCGLAPGFIGVVGNELAQRFLRGGGELLALKMRVGALPRFPSNALKYNLTWSTEGLINEYCNPCEAIVDGRLIEVPAMEEREEFSLDGVTYEAFNTSGGLGTLCETLAGKVRTLNYRTIRYPGHAAIMKTLLNDLNLRNRRDLLKDILEQALPATGQDVVIVFVTVSGLKGGRLMQETYAHKIYSGLIAGRPRSAIQITTAAGICAVLDLLAEGKLPQTGFVRQEDIAFPDFLANRFGRHYAADAAAHGAAA